MADPSTINGAKQTTTITGVHITSLMLLSINTKPIEMKVNHLLIALLAVFSACSNPSHEGSVDSQNDESSNQSQKAQIKEIKQFTYEANLVMNEIKAGERIYNSSFEFDKYFHYDQNGNLIEEHSYTNADQLVNKFVYTYDGNNNLIKVRGYRDFEVPISRDIEYNGDGDVLEIQDEYGTLKYKYVDRRNYSIESLDGMGRIESITYIKKNENDRIIEEREVSPSSGADLSTTRFDYSEDNKLIVESFVNHTDGKGYFIKYQYQNGELEEGAKYDLDSILIQLTEFNENKIPIKETFYYTQEHIESLTDRQKQHLRADRLDHVYSYEYDQHGNKIATHNLTAENQVHVKSMNMTSMETGQGKYSIMMASQLD